MNRLWVAMMITGFFLLWGFLILLLGPPPPELKAQAQISSFHDIGYEDSWIQGKDAKERLVQVQTVESKISIVFRVKKRKDTERFSIGSIAPVTFLCREGSPGEAGQTDCDIGSQEKTYIGNLEVQPTVWKTRGSNTKLKIKNP